MRAAGRVRGLGIAAVLVAGPASSAEVPVCSAEDRDAWARARLTSVGVGASDRHPNLLPDALPGDDCFSLVDFSLKQQGRADDGFHSWVYAAGCKQTLCGRPLSFEKNLAIAFLSGEHDLNNNLEPVGTGKALLEDRYCFTSETGPTRSAIEAPRLCFPSNTHVHVEITPPRGLRPLLRGLWLDGGDWSAWRDLLNEGLMCVYGPFLGDTGHALIAEIHPTQLFWWNENPKRVREPEAADGPYALFVAQDASSRYSKRHHFVLEQPLPPESTWRPWAQGPVHGRFEIPFWAPRGEAPTFRLSEYRLSGEAPPTAEDEKPLSWSVPEGTDTITLAHLRNLTRLPGSYRMDVSAEVLCKECVEGADCAANPRLARGYRAKLVIDAAVGRDLEWEEGHLALRLCDERISCDAGPRALSREAALEPPERRLQSVVTWSADRESWREPALVANETIDQMFARVGWPEAAAHPYLKVKPLARARLRAQAAVSGLTEGEEKSLRTSAVWEGARACSLSDPGDCAPVPLAGVKGERARLELPPEPQTVRQVELTVTVGATLPARPKMEAGPALSRPGPIPPRTDRWTLWSHGFVAGTPEFWSQAVSALCAEKSRQNVALEKMRLGHAPPEARPRGATEVKGVLPLRNVRHLMTTMVRDDVVTMAELRTLVEQVRRVCGFEETVRSRLQAWQAAQ